MEYNIGDKLGNRICDQLDVFLISDFRNLGDFGLINSKWNKS